MVSERSDAFDSVYRDCRDPLLRYVFRRLPREDALDVVAETFAVAWRRRSELPPEPLPWLYRVAYLQTLNKQRQLQRRRSLVERLRSHEPTAFFDTDTAPPDEIRAALDMLRPIDREVILLVAVECLSLQEIATVLRCSTGAAAVRVHRARRRLGTLLEREGRPQIIPEVANLKEEK